MTDRKPRVCVLGAGGTIAGRSDSAANTASYKAGAAQVAELVAHVSSEQPGVDLVTKQLMNIGSKDMDDSALLVIANAVTSEVSDPDVDAVVITHGTDTLEETAYFLNLVVPSHKPVVLVGSMRPATAISADGPLNLLDAIRTACSPEAVGKGVLIVFNGTIFSARDSMKLDTYRPHAFGSNNGPLGLVTESGPLFYRSISRKHTTSSRFASTRIGPLPPVSLLYCHIGVQDYLIHACIDNHARGIVIAGTGNANFPARFKPALERAAGAGIALVRSSRVGNGSSVRFADPVDRELGMIVVDDQPGPKARLLLALGLAHDLARPELAALFTQY